MAFLPVTQLELSAIIPIDPVLEYRFQNGPRTSRARYVKTLRKYSLVYKGLNTANKILIERFITQQLRSITSFEFLHPYGYTISNATNATPILITTTYNHDYLQNDQVLISGVEGNTNANGYHMINVLSNTTFELRDSVGNGAFSDTQGDAKAQVYFPRVKVVLTNGEYDTTEKILGPNKNAQGIFFINFQIEELV